MRNVFLYLALFQQCWYKLCGMFLELWIWFEFVEKSFQVFTCTRTARTTRSSPTAGWSSRLVTAPTSTTPVSAASRAPWPVSYRLSVPTCLTTRQVAGSKRKAHKTSDGQVNMPTTTAHSCAIFPQFFFIFFLKIQFKVCSLLVLCLDFDL